MTAFFIPVIKSWQSKRTGRYLPAHYIKNLNTLYPLVQLLVMIINFASRLKKDYAPVHIPLCSQAHVRGASESRRAMSAPVHECF